MTTNPNLDAALTAAYSRKLWACDQLLQVTPPKPFEGQKRAEVIQAMGILAREATFAPQMMACIMILDWTCPGWKVEDPELFGHTLVREHPDVRAWRLKVLERDGHSCRACGSLENLHAHHVLRWRDYPALRAEVSNGVTLCETCHKQHHSTGALTWH